MNLFITGASGFIGGSLARYLVDRGHAVRGLIRNPDKVEPLTALGITPVLGDLDDAALLAREAGIAEAAINAADSDHQGAVDTLLGVLAGTGKRLVHTSGSSVVGDDARGDYTADMIYEDDDVFVPMAIRRDRVAINTQIRAAATTHDVRATVIAPAMIYGEALGLPAESDQLPKLVRKSLAVGAGVHVGAGVNRWSNVHIADLAALYERVIETAPAGSYFYAENGENSYAEIAAVLGHALGFKGRTQSWPAEEAIEELGDWARFALGSNSRVRARNARQALGWQPRRVPLLDWLRAQPFA
ncbi:male sterility protein-like protein [Salinisphaera sp. T5B8]|uniref:NAD-dependent epimerase/dehydratase family protein n=1 Tax=Salinisphaera sp. T5B8 TaxID=1304154 RepID=UPI00333F6672